MSKKSMTILGIDIGTTKIHALAGEVDPEGVAIISASSQPSYGVKKGSIINMESTIDSIKKAVEEVATMSGSHFHAAVVGMAGSHIKGFNSTGVIPLSNKEVKKADIASAIEAAKSFVIPMDREVLHIIPQEFIVDDQDGIKDPLGMSGVRLESRVYVVTGAVAAAQNVIRCINRTGLKVQDIILQQLASAEAVLTEDEKELGCALVDIGGGTTDIALFLKGSIAHCSVLPIGGSHITSDIAIGIRTPISDAEEIKKAFGNACTPPPEPDASIEVTSIGKDGATTVTKSMLCQIIEARVEETLHLIQQDLASSGLLESLAAGVVITGGTALLGGLEEKAAKILGLPVRIGYPLGISGINDVRSPLYATGIGLILFAARGYMNSFTPNGSQKSFRLIRNKLKHWLTEAF